MISTSTPPAPARTIGPNCASCFAPTIISTPPVANASTLQPSRRGAGQVPFEARPNLVPRACHGLRAAYLELHETGVALVRDVAADAFHDDWVTHALRGVDRGLFRSCDDRLGRADSGGAQQRLRLGLREPPARQACVLCFDRARNVGRRRRNGCRCFA
jgi:hypothetical protein